MAAPYSPVPELNLLKELQDRLAGGYIADGFELIDYGDDSGLRAGCSEEPAFLSRLIVFAQANGSGSEYALWRCDDRGELAELPVVIFGDEGGQGVVACDLRGLLLVLTEDAELAVDWDQGPYFRGEPGEGRSSGRAEYLALLERDFGLTPPQDAGEVLAAAEDRYGRRFAAWVESFLPE